MTDDQSYGHVAVAFAEIARTLFSATTVGSQSTRGGDALRSSPRVLANINRVSDLPRPEPESAHKETHHESARLSRTEHEKPG